METSTRTSRRSSMDLSNELGEPVNGESEGNILCSSLVAEEREQTEQIQPVQQTVPHFYVIINPKSGGRKGEFVMRKFEGLEHCIVNTVFEIDNDKLLHFITHSSNGRIIIGGGDGTINSVLTQLSHIHEHLPPIALLPLGTGNELSRCTGWNSTYNQTDCLFSFLEQAKSGSVIRLDRWNINLNIPGQEPVNKRMLCFFSIGFDAQIADSFDKWREKYPHLCFKQIVNKAWYLGFAMKEAIKTGTRIAPFVDLYVDGHQVHVPFTVSCLHFMNIRSTGDGTDLFAPHQPHRKKDKKDIQKPSMCDEMLEVLGTDSLIHYMKIKYFNSHSHRIAQGKNILLRAKRTFVAQLDGESWTVPEGSTIEISLCDQLQIVRGRRMIEH